ncbi:deleted in lung and esophageal cancer protein 1 [Anabas testudineus]|uniref:DLEC1 cilia and flagella associated protein n=1 Tax=Anabas testudineus TaxID=64144 RepID=A0A3Q1HRV6_ANATE|nr:deleted in lung and esophageal cancer protein 1 [Anabas testudineus]XP_026216994.1 deleted in lung and esophageal cancer protein 1 [Anabas testudineus]XP_026216995.1 deleted in lung and esophageal cancer protein 1 [Anabas testudineus]
MLEEPQARQESRVDPSVNSHRPASGKSQDISHILASTFKDLYTKDIIGKDTLSNLIKTKNGRSSYHDKYVEELQQVHSEYSRRVKEADMLENHFIQARALAAATENQAYEKMKEKIGDVHDHQGLLTVKSAFSCCVDEDLLKRNNLISPQDYLTTQKPRVKAPAAIKSVPGKPTVTYTMHVSREPQDDGYTLIPSSGRAVSEMNESDLSLTFDASSDTPKRKSTPREKPNQSKPRPKWKDKPSMKDQAEGFEKLQKLKERHNFLRNPRFLPPNAQHGGISLIHPRTKVVKTEQERKGTEEQRSTEDSVPVFLAKPSVVVFTDYSVGHVYETTLVLKNVTSSSRHVRVIPPTTPYFSIGLGRFPGEGGVVAPGMSCKYMVRFAPDSLTDYEDFIVVETQAEHLFVVPIAATRPPPVLTLPRVLDCGYCLIGGVKFVEFLCQNVGLSAGTFCIIPKNLWPASNLRSAARTYFSEQPPFAISPSLFVLQPGEATVVEVVFFPTTAEKSCQVFTIVCDNCQVKDISTEGEGQLIALELVSVSGERELPAVGELHDLTAEHFVRFSPCNPHSVQQKKLIIRNNVHLELPFHWQIMKPNLHPLLPGETPEPSHIQFHLATDDVFHVSPPSGLLAPCQDHEFLFTFSPEELKDYHGVCHLVLRDVPQLPPDPSENSVLQPVRPGSKVSDVIVMEIEVKGSTEPYQVLLEPYAIVIPGELFICTTTRRQFKMWNHSKTFIYFQWERMNSSSHIIEVEPSTGRIDENECFDFDLIMTGGKPERVVTSLLCHIEHHHEPVTLAVEVSFKGPIVTLSAPSVDFGLVRLGEQTQTKLLLTNTTQLEASWTMEEKRNSQQDHEATQIIVEPCRGVLLPLASCSVDLLFRPRFCQQCETELELTVENGAGCHLSVRADVQSPQVCLLNCQLLLSDLYIGVPAKGTVTLFNQTLLPSHFTWMSQLQGAQASVCTTSFDPSSGTLGPNSSIEITVSFTSHTDLEAIEVAALCEIHGMDSPLVLGILASKPKKLSVSYSLPNVCSSPDEERSATLVLHFGDDVVLKRTVTKQLLITNQTAIPAPFTMEAEYFSCHPSMPNNQSEKRFTYVKKPLHSVQAKKVEEKAHQEFLSSLLAHGRGAAFFVLPNTGMLGPFETQTVDVTAYTDMWGEYRDHLICKVGDLEPTLIPMQMTVTGCPLYFQMLGPQPHDQNQGPTIQFGTHVSGGDTVSRSVRINNPTMFDIRVDWETYNIDQNDHKLVDVVVTYGDAFPVKDADGNEVMSGALLLSDGNSQRAQERNPTPCSEATSVFLQHMTDEDDEDYLTEEDYEKEQTSLYFFTAKKKISVHIRPHVGNLSDYPYCITPMQMVIPAKSSGTIHVSFTPLTISGSACESRCVGLALGFLSLDSESAAWVPGKVKRAQGLDLEPVRVDLLAAVKPAALFVQMEEDDGVLEFHASSGDLLRAESVKEVVVQEFDITQTFQLNNTSDMPLHFRLGTQPPFIVLKPPPRAQTSTSSNPPAGDSQSLVLQPQHSIQVKVAFHCSLSLLDHVDQTDKEVPLGVMLIHSASGHRKLKFQQNLLIHYSNNSLQTVPLRAYLDLATLCLSTDRVDFGLCYVGQTQTVEVNLCCHGAHTYWKSVIEQDEGDSHVFRVTPDSGLLRFKELNVSSCSECLQIRFTPSGDREFRAIVMIQSPLEKTPITLQLQGTGSFDEIYRSNEMCL